MKRICFWFTLAAFLFAAALPGARAVGLIIIHDQPGVEMPAPRLRPPQPPHQPWNPRPIHRFTPLEIRSVQAEVSIRDQVAQTKITQEFYNPNPSRLEGTFILPLPKGAHLEKFKMEVNGKMTEAELLTADKARGIYEEIVRKAQDPALLEYVGRELIKVRIFPIEPHSTKRVEVSFAQVLRQDSGLIAYTLPLNTAKYSAHPIKNFSLKLDLASATPLKSIYSPSHTIELNRKSDHSAVIGLEESTVKPEKDFQLLYSTGAGLGLNFLTYKKGADEGYFMLLAAPGVENTKVLPKDVVFVIDTSGSMSGKKLEQAKKALQFCVQNLNPQDRFEIIRFSTEIEGLFRELRANASGSRQEAEKFIDQLKTLGGTAIHDALAKALTLRPKDSTRPFLVVFLTDGLPTVGNTSEEGILATVKGQNRGLTRVFCFGLGTDVNTRLLDRISEETSALSQYVLPEEDLEVKLSSFFAKVSDPVLANLELDFGSIRVSKLHPARLPDLFAGQQLIALGRYQNPGRTQATLTGQAGEERKKFTYDVEFGDAATHDFIPRLWAAQRVGFLLDEVRLRGENAELKDEVTGLAKQYGIVTPYTSYLVTEDERMAAAGPERPELSTSYDPLAFYRKNPELMKRYFPHLHEGSSQNLPAAPASAAQQRLMSRTGVSGDAAVAGTRYNQALKATVNEQQMRDAFGESRQFALTGRLGLVSEKQEAAQSQRQFVGNRAFLQLGQAWVEASVQDHAQDKVRRIEFNSQEYWDLASAHAELREIFALGAEVKFLFQGQVCEIYEKKG